MNMNMILFSVISVSLCNYSVVSLEVPEEKLMYCWEFYLKSQKKKV